MVAATLSIAILAVNLVRRNSGCQSDGIRLSEVIVLNEHDGFVLALAFSADGRMLACFNTTFTASGQSNSADIWEVATRRKLATLQVGLKHPMAFSPDGKTLATGHGDYTIRLWDTATWQDRAKQFPPGAGAPVFWLDNTTLATNGWDGQILCDLVSGRTRRITPKYVVEATQVAFAPNGKQMALASPDLGTSDPVRTIELFDVASGTSLWSVETHLQEGRGGAPRCVAFAPDGKILASGGSDRFVRLWDVALGKEIASFNIVSVGHTASVTFSPDGKLLAAGDAATPELPCHVLLWDLVTAERLGVWKTQTGVRQLAFSPDAKRLAVASSWSDGLVELWSVEEMLAKKAK
jgi:WD40 repeat protein